MKVSHLLEESDFLPPPHLATSLRFACFGKSWQQKRCYRAVFSTVSITKTTGMCWLSKYISVYYITECAFSPYVALFMLTDHHLYRVSCYFRRLIDLLNEGHVWTLPRGLSHPRWLSHGHLMGSFFSPVGVFISARISFRAVSGLTDSSSPIPAFYRTGCSESLSSFSNITPLCLHCRSWAMTQVAEFPAPFFFLLYCSVLQSFPSSLKFIPSPLKIPTNTTKQINVNVACGELYWNISYSSVYINIKLPLLCSNSKAEKIVAVNPYFCQVLKNRTKEKYIIPNFW